MFSTFGQASNSLFLNTFLSGIVEIPVNILAVFIINTRLLGRRGTAGLSLIAAGITSFLCALVTNYGKYMEYYVWISLRWSLENTIDGYATHTAECTTYLDYIGSWRA